METCAPLEKPLRGDDARVTAVIWGSQYSVCQMRHELLVDYVTKKQAERGKK